MEKCQEVPRDLSKCVNYNQTVLPGEQTGRSLHLRISLSCHKYKAPEVSSAEREEIVHPVLFSVSRPDCISSL